MLGEEGKDLKTVLDRPISAKAVITVGEKCLVQDNNYLRKPRTAEAESALKPSATEDDSDNTPAETPQKSLFGPRNDSDNPSTKSTEPWLNLLAEQPVTTEASDDKPKSRKHDGKRKRRAVQEAIEKSVAEKKMVAEVPEVPRYVFCSGKFK